MLVRIITSLILAGLVTAFVWFYRGGVISKTSKPSGDVNPFLLSPNQKLPKEFFLVEEDKITVKPGGEIQFAIERAAQLGVKKIDVLAGEYRPQREGQALIWFNHKHNGIYLKAIGKVRLQAGNEKLANRNWSSYPAIVNHVVYFGDGIDSSTVIDGFIIEGANGFYTEKLDDIVEPNLEFRRRLIYFWDGGGVKVAGNSSPHLKNLTIQNNKTALCGAGLSVEQRGWATKPVIIENSFFIANENGLTGSAIDVLPGSLVEIKNTTFRQNRFDFALIEIFLKQDIPRSYFLRRFVKNRREEFENSSSVSVFPHSQVSIKNSRFINNLNAVDYNSSLWYLERSQLKEKFSAKLIVEDSEFFGNIRTRSGYDIHSDDPEVLNVKENRFRTPKTAQ